MYYKTIMNKIIKSISYSYCLCGSLTSSLILTLLNKDKANLFFSSIACQLFHILVRFIHSCCTAENKNILIEHLIM